MTKELSWEEEKLIIAKERLEKIRKEQYWISPSGVCKYYKGNNLEICSCHSEIALELFPDIKYPSDYLFNNGWIMIGSTIYKDPIIHKEPTQSQIDKLFDLDLFDSLLILYTNKYIKYSLYNCYF